MKRIKIWVFYDSFDVVDRVKIISKCKTMISLNLICKFMKRMIPAFFFVLTILSSCNNEAPYLTYDRFDLHIDSVYNITSTSVCIRAKLNILTHGNVPLSGIFVDIGRTQGTSLDSLYREIDFEKIDKVVTLTIDSLTPNTHYYLQTGGRYNPPETEIYRWSPHIRSMTAPSTVSFYTTD
jgi:hypothetical protein